MEFSQKLAKAKNLKLKHKSIFNKNVKNEKGSEEKYFQVYQLIKTTQEKEIQSQNDEVEEKS